MRIHALALTLCLLTTSASAEKVPVWIGMSAPTGGEKEGIYRTTLDSETGALSKPELAAEIGAPGFLAVGPKGDRLYAVCRLPDGESGVAVFEISGDGATLRLLNTQPTGDGESCHVAVDPTGRTLFTAQYGTGSVCAFPLKEDGTIGTRTAHIRHSGTGPNRQRQEGPHPHYVMTDPTNQYLMVPDLGADQIVIYKTDLAAGRITPHGAARSPAGGGPRHMKFHPNGKFAYVLNELDVSVTSYKYDDKAGTMTEFQTITTLPPEMRETFCTGAEIRMHPSGKFLYTSNRGHDSIAAFRIDPQSGKLIFVEHESIRGCHPRNFNLDPSGNHLIVAGRDSNTLSAFKINQETGGLVYAGSIVNSPSPICVEFEPQAVPKTTDAAAK
jgi:6-phosphogluconolactonase